MNDLGFLVQDSCKFSVNTKIGNKLINIQLSYLIQEGDCAPPIAFLNWTVYFDWEKIIQVLCKFKY